jgi:hypothetical protein
MCKVRFREHPPFVVSVNVLHRTFSVDAWHESRRIDREEQT